MQQLQIWLLCVSLGQPFEPSGPPVCLIRHSEAECLQSMHFWLLNAQALRVRSGVPVHGFLAVCYPQPSS